MDDRKSQRILVKRERAYGDVLCVEPTLRALNRCYPDARVYFQTQCEEILRYARLPTRNIGPRVEAYHGIFRPFDKIINLDLAYEKRPLLHIVDAYAEEAAVELCRKHGEQIPVYDRTLTWTGNGSRIIVVNSDGSLPNRRWDLDRWKRVIERIRRSGYVIIEIGKTTYLGVGENRTGTLTLRETAALISKAELYMGFDGALMHVAQALGTPIFIVFGCTCPTYRIHDWSKARVVWLDQDQLDCAGCHHWRPAPRLFTECDREEIFCLRNISEDRVLDMFYFGENGQCTEPLRMDESKPRRDDQSTVYQCYAHTRPFLLSRPIIQQVRNRRGQQIIHRIKLLIGTFGRTVDTVLRVDVLDELDNVLDSGSYAIREVADNSYVNIELRNPVTIPSSLFKIRISPANVLNRLVRRISLFLDESRDDVIEVSGTAIRAGIHMVVF